MDHSEYLEVARRMMPDGWQVVHGSVLRCPHGYRIEWDGACPEGCVSPLRELGLI